MMFQSHPKATAYCITSDHLRKEPVDPTALPIPPHALWHNYGSDVQEFLDGGKRHVDAMAQVLQQSGYELGSARRILDFGCGAARMARHLPMLAPKAELWGVDASGDHIRWCVNYLSPVIHFAACTFVPHLPFEDRYFDFVFAGSVFTHIEDTQEAWLLELARILRPGGRVYITIHDEHTVRLLESQYPDLWLTKWLTEQPFYRQCADNFELIVVNRGPHSQVFYRKSYLQRIVPPVFRWVSHTPEMYAYQSAVLLQKQE